MLSFVILALCALSAHASRNLVPYSACVDMKPKGPGHRYADPQPKGKKAPYDFHLEHSSIRNTESVEFTIRAKHDDKPFQGFMIQVRDDDSQTPTIPIGTFWSKSDDARTVECTNPYDTGSHSSDEPKTSVSMVWTPPANFKGKATFYVTVAQTQFVYWPHMKVEHVHVKEADD